MERLLDKDESKSSATAARQPWFRRSSIVFEQAVYGSFAFNDQGYAMLASSPGCRAEWLADFRAACRNLGEPPAGCQEAPGMFSLRLPSGPRAVVGVFFQGRDDQGRPGALAFHGLFLSPRDFRKIGCDPFVLAGCLYGVWSPDTHLVAGEWHNTSSGFRVPRVLLNPCAIAVAEHTGSGNPWHPDRRELAVEPIVSALRKGRRVALESSSPIDELARSAWTALPIRVRARASLATWAFGNANRFDLLGTPRRSALLLDSTYLDTTQRGASPRSLWHSPQALAVLSSASALALAGVVLTIQGERDLAPPAVTSSAPSALETIADDPRDDTATERRRLREALVALCGRFGVDVEEMPDAAPAALMEKFASEVRYDGPTLSEADRAALAREASHDAALALRWDEHVRRFAGDEPLPSAFRSLSTRAKLTKLARVFHVESEVLISGAPHRSPAERVQELGDALAVDLPLHALQLAARFPVLADYQAFLDRLPRR